MWQRAVLRLIEFLELAKHCDLTQREGAAAGLELMVATACAINLKAAWHSGMLRLSCTGSDVRPCFARIVLQSITCSSL